MLDIGDKAPYFQGFNQNNQEIKLSDFQGKKLVLYFYPKDDTPGCTKEACSFRDNFSELTEKGIEIIGVSIDNITSHDKFQKKYNLPFNLVADPDKEIVNIYGVYREKNLYGKLSMGTVRTTFLIDENNVIVHIFKRPKSEIHASEVLNKFDSL